MNNFVRRGAAAAILAGAFAAAMPAFASDAGSSLQVNATVTGTDPQPDLGTHVCNR